jgi:hypothetical protein
VTSANTDSVSVLRRGARPVVHHPDDPIASEAADPVILSVQQGRGSGAEGRGRRDGQM